MNATAEYQSVLRSASDVAGKKTLHRDAVRAADDAAHDLHDVRGRLRFWAQVQAMTPFIAVGTAVAAVIVGLIFGSFLPAGTFRTGSFTLLALLVPAAVGAFVFWVATGVVAELRQQATRARSAVNLAERDLLAAGEDLADAENGYWARKRPTV